ncbi:MAG: hypothetical protein ACRD01_01600, partial [Terriglobales bacterium]
MAAGRARFLLILGDIGHQGFGGEYEAGDGAGVLQGKTGHLGRVNHARLDQVLVGAGLGVVPEVGVG